MSNPCIPDKVFWRVVNSGYPRRAIPGHGNRVFPGRVVNGGDNLGSSVPFTLSHVAAVLPVRRATRTGDARGRTGPLVASALAVGSMAPDAVLFVNLRMTRHDSHALLGGVLLVDVLVVAVLVGAWHVLFRRPLLALLPDRVRARVEEPLRPRLPARLLADARAGRPWAGAALAAAGWFVVSAWLGGLAHIGWDTWTHQEDYGVAHVAWLREPWIGGRPGFVLLQHLSTVVGLAVLLAWAWRVVARLPERPLPPRTSLPVAARLGVLAALVAAGALVAVRRTFPLKPGDWFTQISHVGFDVSTGFGRGCAAALVLYALAWYAWRAVRTGRRTAL
jgi:hypothetical protein